MSPQVAPPGVFYCSGPTRPTLFPRGQLKSKTPWKPRIAGIPLSVARSASTCAGALQLLWLPVCGNGLISSGRGQFICATSCVLAAQILLDMFILHFAGNLSFEQFPFSRTDIHCWMRNRSTNYAVPAESLNKRQHLHSRSLGRGKSSSKGWSRAMCSSPCSANC